MTMDTISRLPAYNLSYVLRATGLKPDALRAWERRYELPRPQRTPGGHRLYSEYDIEILKWLKARQTEGLSISRAAELWKETVATGRDPLSKSSVADVPALPAEAAADSGLERLRHNWLDACLAFEGQKAEAILSQAFAIYPVETVCTDILQQGISWTGSEWYGGKVSAQQEHFVTAQAVRRLETLINAAPAPTRAQTVLLGCPAGEFHTFPVQLLSLLLCRRGLKVIYLGADLPAEQMEETAAAICPNLMVLSAQRLATAASLQSAAYLLQRQNVPLAYGGLIFHRIPQLRERMPAHYLGESLAGAVGHIERLLVAPPIPPASAGRDDNREALARQYRERRPRIELVVIERLRQEGVQVQNIEEQNAFLSSGLAAAFQLGDAAFLEADVAWVTGLLAGRHISAGSLLPYLAAYSYAVRTELGEAGASLTAWIDAHIAQTAAAQSKA